MAILKFETEQSKDAFSSPPRLPPSADGSNTTSPPFLPSSIADAAADALPYHWLELGEILLEAAPDDFEEPDQVRRLMRDLREVRMAKLRAGVDVLVAGGGFKMNGVGGMEVAEGRAFIGGVIDGLRYGSRNLCVTGWTSVLLMIALSQEDWRLTRAAAPRQGTRGAREWLYSHD